MVLKSPQRSLKGFLGPIGLEEERIFNACVTVTLGKKKRRRIVVEQFGDQEASRLSFQRRVREKYS